MIKKLDTFHYILILLLVGTLVYFNFKEENYNNTDVPKDHYEYLMAKFKADSLFLSQNYAEARAEYVRVDSIYPYRLNLPAIQLLIDEKQKSEPENLTINQPIAGKTNSENSAKSTLKTPPASKSVSYKNTNQTNINPDSSTTDDFQHVGEIVKGVLHLINYDGAQIDYIGEVQNGKANGFGFAVFEHKGFYEGEWADNMRNGKGVYSWQNGEIYDGYYVNGKRNGYGEYTFLTGDVYKGYWKDNLRHGEGILYNKKGKVVSNGPWVQDEPVLQKRVKKKKK